MGKDTANESSLTDTNTPVNVCCLICLVSTLAVLTNGAYHDCGGFLLSRLGAYMGSFSTDTCAVGARPWPILSHWTVLSTYWWVSHTQDSSGTA